MIGALRGRTPAELLVRLEQAGARRLDRLGIGAAVRLPDDAAFLRRLAGAPRDAAAVLVRFRADGVSVFPALREPAATAELVRQRWPTRVAELLARADRLHEGRFDLLGHSALSFGAPVDWHLDAVSGKRSPVRHWSRLDPLDASLTGDHKVVWELNRHQHLPLLARAWLLSGEERHARLLFDHLAAWMKANEPKRGINWTSSLELAYRCIAWLWALKLARHSAALEPKLLLTVLEYLWLQGRHVERHLSTYYSPNTHLTGEALGLLYLGVMVPELPDAARWRRRGWRILMEELSRHVLADGTYFERASYYHRYTVDIYTHALLLGRAMGAPAGELGQVEDGLHRLLDHLLSLTRPDGTTPFIGDDDGGHLWLPEPGRLDDFRPSLANGAALFLRPDLAFVSGGVHEETLWLLGAERVAVCDGLEAAEPERRSAAFVDGGYYIMRDGWGAGASLMVIDAGPLGVLNCGHAHADALSFDLSVNGRAVFVDPGTFSYVDPQSRNHFRSSAAHNTITLGGNGSSVPGGPFQWRSRTDAHVEQWLSRDRFDYLHGVHGGFRRIASPGEHRREVLFARGEWWLIRDRVVAGARVAGELNFQLAPSLRVEARSNGASVVDVEGAGVLQVFAWGSDGHELRSSIADGWVSRAYGCRERAPRWVVQQDSMSEVVTLLIPGRVRPDVAISRHDGGLRIGFDLAGVEHVVLIGGTGRIAVDEWESDAQWLWARRSAPEFDADLVAIDVGTLKYRGRSLLDANDRMDCFETRLHRPLRVKDHSTTGA